MAALETYAALMQGEEYRTLAELLELPEWRQHAACRGVTDVTFHPERGEDARPAKAICAGCFVQQECLDFALDTAEKVGIWGGLSERERRRVRQRRNVERRAA